MEKEDRPSMINLFIKHCLLFQSKEKLFWFFGAFVWLDLLVLIYAVIKILFPTEA